MSNPLAFDEDSKNLTVEQSPKTIETCDEAGYTVDRRKAGPNLFIVDPNDDGASHSI